MKGISTAEFADALEALDVTLPIVLAVSGGPDSVALMRLTAQWAQNRSLLSEVVAVTVDHGLRPESAHEAMQVAGWAQAVGLRHETLAWSGQKPEGNLQAQAREARYALLADFCTEIGSTCLVTAHHVDDQAETFVLRLARGSGVDGLAAMSPIRELTSYNPPVRLLRPLLQFPRQRLRATLSGLGQGWIEDPSNDDARFERVKARRLIEDLGEVGLTPERIVATSERMAQAREALAVYRDALFARAVRLYPAGYCTLDRTALSEAPREVGLRCLSKCLKIVSGAAYGPRYERLTRLYDGLLEDGFDGKTLHGCQLAPHQSTVLVYREYRAVKDARAVIPDEGEILWDHRFWVGGGSNPSSDGAVCAPLEVRPLGEAGVAFVKAQEQVGASLIGLPRLLTYSLPAVWLREEVVLVPFGLYQNEAFLRANDREVTFRLRVAG